MLLRRTLTITLFFAFIIGTIEAVEVKQIKIDSFEMFQKGEFNTAQLDNLGRLSLGPNTTRLNGPAKEYYLCFDINDQGDILLGCGHGAEVFKITSKDNTPVSIFKSEEPDVHAVLQHKSGAVIVATGPNGKLYNIDEKGNSSIIFDPKEKYIWDIIEDLDGSIIAAVGDPGGVYRITLTGKVSKIFDTEDTHITSLHLSPNNILYAGSGDRGIIYIVNKNKTKVLFDSGYKEIRGITSDHKANVYFAATHYDADKKNLSIVDTNVVKMVSKTNPNEGLRSVIYQHLPNGNIEEIFSLKNETIFNIDYDLKTQRLLVATGNSGRVYQVKPNGEYSIIYESDAAQIYRISSKGPGATMITNNSASLIRLDDSNNSSGNYTSDIFDLTIQSRIGNLYWQDEKPEGAQIAVTLRAGNSSKPDNTWTAWLPPFLHGNGAATNLAGYRFVQLKVLLNAASNGKDPFLEQLRFFYLQNNLTPKFNSIRISPQSSEKDNQSISPNGTPVVLKAINKGDLLVSWACQDPNDDPMTYTLFLRPVSSSKWFPFKSNLTQTSVLIPTGHFEDGRYQIKAIASDAPTNPPNFVKTSEILSTTFTIDSTPPSITQFSVSNNQIRFTVSDTTSTVKQVQFSWDGETWLPLFPDDLISDSSSESFSLTPTASARMVFLKAEDEFGNGTVYQKDIL